MTTEIKIVTTQSSNGDCELGCWNEGSGGIVEIDGKCIFAKEAWATCTDNSELTLGDLFNVVLKHFGIDANLTIENAHPDDYNYDDYDDEEVLFENENENINLEPILIKTNNVKKIRIMPDPELDGTIDQSKIKEFFLYIDGDGNILRRDL